MGSISKVRASVVRSALRIARDAKRRSGRRRDGPARTACEQRAQRSAHIPVEQRGTAQENGGLKHRLPLQIREGGPALAAPVRLCLRIDGGSVGDGA